ncbi:MAG: flagellar biosynthetic protein FliQ [Candidatus Eremiobacteraeota bacterium]|nr:flagellar biosynthetic protein FliQ [Candidatus Eremiobacteraeota bacterium]
MTDLAMELYALTMQTALMLAMPVVAAVACVGIVVSLLQTVVGIQDQNISFGPKIAVVALLLALGGLPALALLAHLLVRAIAALPRLIG